MSKSKNAQDLLEMLAGASMTKSLWRPTKSFRPEERWKAAEANGCLNVRRVRGQKDLIETRHYAWKAVMSVDRAANYWWNYNTYPYVIEGQRLYLRENRDYMKSKIEEFDQEIKKAARQMDQCREEIIEASKIELGEMFDPTLFPASWEPLFSVRWIEVNISPPDWLRSKNEKEYELSFNQMLASVETSMRVFEQQCFNQMGDAVSRMMNNLGGPGVRMSNVEAFQKLFNRVQQMKFEGTEVFKNAMAEAKDIIDGVDVLAMRREPELKDQATDKLKKLVERYAQLQEAIRNKNRDEEVVEV